MPDFASLSPARRAWLRFKRHRLGYWSLMAFAVLVALSLLAELLSNDKPLILRYEGAYYFPVFKSYPETVFGGDFHTETDYLDPYIRQQFEKPGNWAIYPPNPYGAQTINYFSDAPAPAAPSRENWLGTDDRGRDLLAQLLYGFRVSALFGLALTALGVALGVAAGAAQGFFGGKVDLAGQRFIETWSAMPELYLLIIFSAVLSPSVSLLIVLLGLFGWMGLSDYVRAEFLRNRQLDYVRAARALGVSRWRLVWRHLLPNSLTPVVTFLPFRIDFARLPGPGRAARHPFAGRAAQPGQKQHRRLVDLPFHFRRAGCHPAAAHLHGRRPARRAGPAQGADVNHGNTDLASVSEASLRSLATETSRYGLDSLANLCFGICVMLGRSSFIALQISESLNSFTAFAVWRNPGNASCNVWPADESGSSKTSF